jgi:hypothetical protein
MKEEEENKKEGWEVEGGGEAQEEGAGGREHEGGGGEGDDDDLVGVQEVRWDTSGTELSGKYTFFYGKEREIWIWYRILYM